MLGTLLLAATPLVVGVLIHQLAQRWKQPAAFIDGVVVTGLIVLVLGSVLPHALTLGGPWVLAIALVGLAVPGILERYLTPEGHTHEGHDDHGHSHHHPSIPIFGLLGLALHALLDGAALGHPEQLHDTHQHGHGVEALGIGVLLHRIPVGMAVWDRLPRKQALGVLAIIVLMTAAGMGSSGLIANTESQAWGFFQAFLGGLLLHVAIEPGATHTHTSRQRFLSGLGAITAVVLFFAWAEIHPVVSVDGLNLSFESTALRLLNLGATALMTGFAIRKGIDLLPIAGRSKNAAASLPIEAIAFLAAVAGPRTALVLGLAYVLIRAMKVSDAISAGDSLGAQSAWLGLGILGAGALEASMMEASLEGVSGGWLLAGCGAAAVLRLPMLSLIPVTMVLVHKGLPAHFAAWLLLAGPLAIAPLFEEEGVSLGRITRWFAATAACYGAVLLVGLVPTELGGDPRFHALGHEGYSWLLVVWATLVGAHLIRGGPRLLITGVLNPACEHHHH